jgi:pimeloyl-ACP methyl ester carboxylesterase
MYRHAFMPARDAAYRPDREAKVGGASLRYFDKGEGEPVILIHGTSLCDSLSAPLQLYPPFYERHRVISYYRAGYGGSTFEGDGVSIEDGARHAVELLDHLGIAKAHLLAYSFGAVIGFDAILQYPDRFASAALLEPYLPRQSQKAIDANNAAGMAAYGLFQTGDVLGAGLAYMEAICGPSFLSAVQMTEPLDVWEQAIPSILTTFQVDFAALMGWSFNPSQADTYAPQKTPVPVLACMGLDSESVVPGFRETQEFLMRWLPDVEPAGIPNATHGMQTMNPHAVGEAVVDFFGRHPIVG